MPHDHSVHDHHHHEVTDVNSAFIIGIFLNTAFVVIELIVGFTTSSLALISDAGHNATDVLSLLLSLFAFKMLKVKATEKYSYGYKKVSILVSLLNAIFLIITVAFIFYEGVRRINAPVEIQGKTVSIIAFIGIFVNGISAWLFLRGKDKDINVRSAYLHMLSDAMVSAGVVIAGIIIYFTHWFWLDTALSFVIGLIILISTWRLLGDSIRMALDGTPPNVKLQKIKDLVTKFPGVVEMHHIHIWPISSSENAMTAHLVVNQNNLLQFEKDKPKLKHDLLHLDIHHVTFETETEPCDTPDCLPGEEHDHVH
jgi:cobalt-zinc-cadmium efflux system protein